MRLKRRRQHNCPSVALWVLFTIGTCGLAVGCQGPQFDHVDGSSTTFNANRIPTVDNQPVADAKTPAGTAPAANSDQSPNAATPSAATQPAVATNDTSIAENLNRGHREAALNHLDQAETYYRRVLEREPENPVANHRLAVLADKKHDFARAESYYLAALQRDGANPDLLGDLGYSYLLQGRREESERYLLEATRVDPSHAKALHNLSLLYAKNGDYDRSFDALRRAVGDSEARVKIARLFPNGRPGSTDGDAMIASFRPSTTSDESTPAPADNSNNVSRTETPPSFPQAAATESAWPTVPVVTNTSAPRSGEATPVPVSNARVPDSHINDIFAAIDREESGSPRTAPVVAAPPVQMPAQLPAPPPTATVTGSNSNGFDGHDLQAAPGTDPLASMPLWPPTTSAPQRRTPPAAFTFDADNGSQPSAQPAPLPQLPGPGPNEAPLPNPKPAAAALPLIEPQQLGSPQPSGPAMPLGQNDLNARRSAALTDELPDLDSPTPTITAGPSPPVATDVVSKYPRAIPTGVVLPTGAVADKPQNASAGTALSDYKVELQREWGSTSGVRTQSNAGAARDPLIVPRPTASPASAANPFSPTSDAAPPQPFEASPALRIQPRNSPTPLFEPVEGFGPANDFAPGDNTSVPAWPSTNGSAPPADGDAGPTIRPRSEN